MCYREKPWWERKLNVDQFDNLLNTWYSELPDECNMFANFVNEAAMHDMQIIINASKVVIFLYMNLHYVFFS